MDGNVTLFDNSDSSVYASVFCLLVILWMWHAGGCSSDRSFQILKSVRKYQSSCAHSWIARVSALFLVLLYSFWYSFLKYRGILHWLFVCLVKGVERSSSLERTNRLATIIWLIMLSIIWNTVHFMPFVYISSHVNKSMRNTKQSQNDLLHL